MYKVLLVDDEILVREAISAKIEWNKLGYELACVCENGKAAVEFIEKTPVDVVLTDICMPYIDGMELSRYLHENYPQTAIIIFSGYSDFEYAKQAIQYKVSEYILKPVTAKELTEVLERVKGKLDGERQKKQKLDKMTKVYHNYTKNESVIISKSLSRLVKGTQEVERSLRELDEFGIEIKGSEFRAVVADIDLYSEPYSSGSGLKKESALMSFVVENISEEIVSANDSGIAYRDSDNRVCLLLWKKPYGPQLDAIKLCKEIQENVYTAMKLSVSMGIGCSVKSLEELSKSYETAADILKYRYSKGIGVIFDCESGIEPANPMELEAQLKEIATAIRGNDKKTLYGTLDYIESWMTDRYVSRNQAAAYLQQVVRSVYENVNNTDEEFQLPDTVAAAVADARNIVEAMDFVREYARKGLEAVEKAGQTSGERQAVLAMNFIKENYSNPNLGLNDICEYLNISTSRFSSIFKEATGKTFTEILTNVRMEKAKQLLTQTTLKNYEIAERVGFSDPHYFSVAFKKMTGMTPKEYSRENS